MNIAIIGAGISGLSTAYYLQDRHRVTVYESAERIGGHTATVDVELGERHYAIDTGFIVYNDWTYPNFIQLLDELGVESQATDMSFSVRCENSGIEYGGSDLNTLFAQRRNLLRPTFWGMLRDILRFNRESVAEMLDGRLSPTLTLGEYLRANGYGEEFVQRYLLPMGCAIWSASTRSMLEFPLLFFVRFFYNHGLLSVNNRPQWRVIEGGSRSYLEPLCAGFRGRIHTSARIEGLSRDDNGVTIRMMNGSVERYDQVVLACHSDQALKLLADPSSREQEVLGAFPYQTNDVLLHTDSRLLPRATRAWSSWNYWLRREEQERAVLTYNMNILQGLPEEPTFCVTLNASDAVDSEKVLGHFEYAHPVFSERSVAAAEHWADINGPKNTWFCGAYWGNGFHEDGVVSAKRVATALIGLDHSSEMSTIPQGEKYCA